MEKTKPNTSKYIAAFSLTTLVFIAGIFLGNFIAQSGLTDLKEREEVLMAQLLGLDLQDRLITLQEACEVSLRDIREDKVELGRSVELLEKRFGKLNPEVLRQKELYQLIEIKTLLLLKERKEECDEDYSIILFFYTNEKDDPRGSYKESGNQGIVLNALYNKYPDYINTFAFDVNTDNPALNTLKSIYNIDSIPTLIIDDELYADFKSLEELKEILELE